MMSMDHRNVGDYSNGPVQQRWNPYAMNGGTVLAIAGEDFAVVAGDTRLSEGFSIMSRDCEKTYNLTEKTVLGCAGFHGDVLTLTKNIQARLKMYEQEHGTKMNSNAIAAMLASMLYGRRFFPFYVSNIVAGLDEQGKGCVYSYDPVGSYEREVYKAAGSASSMLQPLLDSQIGGKNNSAGNPGPLSREKAVALIKDVFISAAERDIYTGDAVSMKIIDKNGITVETFKLRRD